MDSGGMALRGRSLVAVVAIAVVVAIPAGAAAFSFYDQSQTPRSSLQFCIESSPPSVAIEQARVLLTNAIAHWHAAPSLDFSQALTLGQDTTPPCAGGTIRVQWVWDSYNWAATDNAAGTIVFHGQNWWNGIGSQGSAWGYEGVLVHEMGHTFGLHHAGDLNWSYDSYMPTMAECPHLGSEPQETVLLETIQQDDWGGAAYVRGGNYRYWNANPGFEKDLTYWGYSGGVGVGAAYAYTGVRGAYLGQSGNYVYMTSVYDPWYTAYGNPLPGELPGMDTTSPTLHIRGYYRHPSASATGGVQPQYRRRFVQYNEWDCKTRGFIANTSWSVLVNLGSACGDPGTLWTACDRSVVIDNSSTNDATALQAYLRSTSSLVVHMDKVGVYGGTSP